MNANTSPINLNAFLKTVKYDKTVHDVKTHSRIPGHDDELNIEMYGGVYSIPDDQLDTFYGHYIREVFDINCDVKQKMCFTEFQIKENGPLLVDLDFNYSTDIKTRQYDADDITQVLYTYLDVLNEVFDFSGYPEAEGLFDIYVMEKENIVYDKKRDCMKDGVHILFGIAVNQEIQEIIREIVLVNIEANVVFKEIRNSMDDVIDKAISSGNTGWQLYGSSKPNKKPYLLSQYYKVCMYNGELVMRIQPLDSFNFTLLSNFHKLSARNSNNPKFEMNEQFQVTYSQYIEIGRQKHQTKTIKRQQATKQISNPIGKAEFGEDDAKIQFLIEEVNKIKNIDDLNESLHRLFDIASHEEVPKYNIALKQLNEYVQVLPALFYEPGSHVLNQKVAFALKNRDTRMFLSWIKLRSNASDFMYSDIPELFRRWVTYFNVNGDQNGIKYPTIIYWANEHCPEECKRIKQKAGFEIITTSLSSLVDDSVKTVAEYSIAQVLHHLYKDTYVCVNKKAQMWYRYNGQRWVEDPGITLRDIISNQLWDIYSSYIFEHQSKLNEMSKLRGMPFEHEGEENKDDEKIKSNIKKCVTLSQRLRMTSTKCNIIKESMDLFYDEDFCDKMDTNKYLLGFNNGVVDFKNKVFRAGQPGDYITKTTNIDYIPFSEIAKSPELTKLQDEVIELLHKIFPEPEVNRYMWDHLSSILIGGNRNEKIHFYYGTGKNGKSKLMDLMTAVLGKYSVIGDIQFLTRQSPEMGKASPEVYKFKGIRLVNFQEPSTGATLYEGPMKIFTGEAKMQARGLYKDIEEFPILCQGVVCTNKLLHVKDTGDGTWRRIVQIPCQAKFASNADEREQWKKEKYLFPADPDLVEKIPKFAPVFASLLVKRAFETEGLFPNCEYIHNLTNEYRMSQNHPLMYVEKRLVKTADKENRLTKNMIQDDFKQWMKDEFGFDKISQSSGAITSLYEIITEKFGKYGIKGWRCMTFNDSEFDDGDA